MSEITTLTVGPLMTSAAEVVSQFGNLILAAVGLSLGVGFVGLVIRHADAWSVGLDQARRRSAHRRAVKKYGPYGG